MTDSNADQFDLAVYYEALKSLTEYQQRLVNLPKGVRRTPDHELQAKEWKHALKPHLEIVDAGNAFPSEITHITDSGRREAIAAGRAQANAVPEIDPARWVPAGR